MSLTIRDESQSATSLSLRAITLDNSYPRAVTSSRSKV
jgi:hypothetical protein